ncbi:hypothetical protein B566_EDAN016651 [Ephemera danica]|nr:hypothetical protein B566_EDAN016651 [Ephemera danica]
MPRLTEDQELALDKVPSLSGSVLMIAPWTTIKSVISKSINASEQHWIVAPTDVSWQGIADDEDSHVLPKDTLFLVNSEGHAPRLQEALQNETWLSEPTALGQLELPELLLRQAARAVQLAAARLQNAIKTDCGTDEEGLCPELKPLTQHALTEERESLPSDIFHIPQHEPTPTSEPVMRLGRVNNDKLEVIASLQQFNQEIQLHLIDNTSAVPFCSTCVCLNNVNQAYSLWQHVHWRHEVWVATVTSIAAVGILCAIAIAIFITVRICKGDVLEGNPAYSFVLLGAVMAAYIAVLPYCVIGPLLVCVLRELGTALGHAFLLGTMLARAIMLASTDDQGFMSHVNGYLQAALWFFIIGVQVALSTQQWILRSSTDVSGTENVATSCMSETTTFLLLLSYTMLLLFLLVLVCPLVVRSKRNYREGFCFTVATVLYTITWLLWIISYVLVPAAWQAPVAAAGLVAGASAVLIAVFIPRTYLIVSSVARARLASAIPCTAPGMHSNSVLDINYRSHQALYDSVNAMGSCNAPPAQLIEQGLRRSPALNRHTGTGLANPNYYSEHPLPCSGSAASTVVAFGRSHAHMPGGSTSREQLSPSPENTYERYDSPPSPHKVTRF